MKVKSLSRVHFFATPWTVAYQAPLSMAVSRQEYWSGVPFRNKPTCRCWSEPKPQVVPSFRVRRPPPPPPAVPVQRAPQGRCFAREMGGQAESQGQGSYTTYFSLAPTGGHREAEVEPIRRPCTPPVPILPSRSPPDQVQFLESIEPLDLGMNPHPSFCYHILQIPQSVLKPA